MFRKSALIHHHAAVLRTHVSKQKPPEKELFPGRFNPFHFDKPEFMSMRIQSHQVYLVSRSFSPSP